MNALAYLGLDVAMIVKSGPSRRFLIAHVQLLKEAQLADALVQLNLSYFFFFVNINKIQTKSGRLISKENT